MKKYDQEEIIAFIKDILGDTVEIEMIRAILEYEAIYRKMTLKDGE